MTGVQTCALPIWRLDKHASAENAQFDELGRGDLVQLTGLERRGDGLRVVPGVSGVERLAPVVFKERLP